MLRLTDARGGGTVDVGRRLRLLVAPAPGDVRAPVVADALRRAVELTGGRSQVCAVGDGWDLVAYGVPPADHTGPREAHDAERFDVEVGPAGADSAAGCLLAVAPVDGTGATADPLALRLLLLGVPRTQPVTVSADALAAAGRRLAGWRAAVARWAESPSAAVPPAYVERIGAALTGDLDLPAVLGALDATAADDEVAPGARFETYAYADRVLALELVRDVGAG